MHQSNSTDRLQCASEEFFHISPAYKFNDCGYNTMTSIEQKRTEELVEESVKSFLELREIEFTIPRMLRAEHVKYLRSSMQQLASGYQTMDASRTWMTYWVLHGLNMLDEPIGEDCVNKIIKFIKSCQSPMGGFGGGPGQKAHLATTYASVMALCSLGVPEAYKAIDREWLYHFLISMKNHDGSFRMHEDGETDVRGVYCAAAVAQITNISTERLFDKTAEWVIACQTYEGGFGAAPGCEAHGGYTFCGLATLTLLGRSKLVHQKSLMRWLAHRQMRYEGGLNGRTNKLVDGCYSFWQSAAFQIYTQLLSIEKTSTVPRYDCKALQHYILLSCQHTFGGLIDKPGKNRDLYHTCYTMAGLSIAQHFGGSDDKQATVIGCPSNELVPVHPVFNITMQKEALAIAYFNTCPLVA